MKTMLEDQDDLSTDALTLHPRLLRVWRENMAQPLHAGPLEPGGNSWVYRCRLGALGTRYGMVWYGRGL